MIGMCCVRRRCLISPAVSNPSSPGIWTSRRIASSATRFCGWSSTSRMLTRSGSVTGLLPGQPPAHEGQELAAVDRLGDVVGRAGCEALLAVALHRLGCQRDDRELLELGSLP